MEAASLAALSCFRIEGSLRACNGRLPVETVGLEAGKAAAVVPAGCHRIQRDRRQRSGRRHRKLRDERPRSVLLDRGSLQPMLKYPHVDFLDFVTEILKRSAIIRWLSNCSIL